MKNAAPISSSRGRVTNSPARISPDAGAGDRFWYWFGASGERYIHSVYGLAGAPLLPGAVYVAARRPGSGQPEDSEREALACGVLPAVLDGSVDELLAALGRAGAEELHLHMLAADPREAAAICDDLRAALGVGAGEPHASPGFGETAAPLPLFACA